MSEVTHSTVFGWSVVLALVAVAFFLGALNMKVERMDSDLSFIRQMMLNGEVTVSRR